MDVGAGGGGGVAEDVEKDEKSLLGIEDMNIEKKMR